MNHKSFDCGAKQAFLEVGTEPEFYGFGSLISDVLSDTLSFHLDTVLFLQLLFF